MKYLLVLLVVVVGLWLMLRPRRSRPAPPARPAPPPAAPADMVACARCDLRLPRGDALFDAEGRPYCDDAHRRAGPR